MIFFVEDDLGRVSVEDANGGTRVIWRPRRNAEPESPRQRDFFIKDALINVAFQMLKVGMLTFETKGKLATTEDYGMYFVIHH
jgi:hypothetical protein